MSCDPERVTAYVDGELPAPLERLVARHLASCSTCAGQAVFEVELASTLSEIALPRPCPGFAARMLAAALSQPAAERC